MDINQRVQPQKRKKKQSIQAKAKDSTTVINVHTASSSIEEPNPRTLCKFKLHPEVKYERSNIPVHDHRNIPNEDMEKSKSSQLKAEEYHLAAHMRNLLEQKYKLAHQDRPISRHVTCPREPAFQRLRSLVAELLLERTKQLLSRPSLPPSISLPLPNPIPIRFLENRKGRFSLQICVSLERMKVMEEVVEENEVKPLTAEQLEQYESQSESESESDDSVDEEEEDADEDEDDDDDDDADDDEEDDDDEEEDDDDDVQEVVQSSGGPPIHSVDDEDDEDEDNEDGEGGGDDDDGEGDDDDDDDEGEPDEEDELGTEYLVRPVGRAEDEEDASDFEPEENGDDEDVEDEDEGDDAGGKVEAPPKRKRSDKDDSDDDDDDGGEDDERPSKR
ncbi:uncharacterized protein [Pyrus communis]|uniref:uncharacterized protein n=1 Tax=Pyrus communis TaxID=23211 RepID=UPI0035C20FEE